MVRGVGASLLLFHLGMSQFSREISPTWDVSAQIQTEGAHGRVDAFAFAEPGPAGQWGLDAPEIYYRLGTEDMAALIGRARPLEQGIVRPSHPLTAWGSAWVQNQTRPLDPVTSGWLGLSAYRRTNSGLFFTASVSPVFLPNFGPRLDLSPTSSPSGSRFANLPPQFYDVGGVWLPLHYQISVGDLSRIILQPQAYGSFGYRGEWFSGRLALWSAPSPTPQVAASGKLRVVDDAQRPDVFVLVEATPSFPRENLLGAEFEFSGIWSRPRVQLVSAVDRSDRWAISVEVQPFRILSLGALHEHRPEAVGPSKDPTFGSGLVWAQLAETEGRFRPSVRWLSHINDHDQFAEAALGFALTRHSIVQASARFLVGPDLTYFGNWRNLDSVGIRWEWLL